MTDPAVLKRQREGHSMATRRTKEVTDVFSATPSPDPIKLEQLRRGLSDTFDTLKHLDDELMPHVDAGDKGKEIEDSEKIKDELYAAIARVERALLTVPGTPPAPMPTAAAGPTVTAKLPKIILKHFHGSITVWTPFGMHLKLRFITTQNYQMQRNLPT